MLKVKGGRKVWLFDFCEVLARVSGKRQCAKCVSAKILLKMCGGKKIKNIGSACVSAFWSCQYSFFLFSHNGLLSIYRCLCLFLHLAVTVWRYVFVADFEALSCQVTRNFIRCRNAEIPTVSAIKYTACYRLVFCLPVL